MLVVMVCSQDGGAISSRQGSITVEGSSFTGNSAVGRRERPQTFILTLHTQTEPPP